MAPRHKSNDVGNSDMPKTSHKLLPLNENVKVLNKKNKKSYAEVTEIYSKNKSIYEIAKKKKFVLVLLSHLILQKL